MTADNTFDRRLAEVLQSAIPGAANLHVINISRTFGGNARQAWSFELIYRNAGIEINVPCILLSQVAGRHVESDINKEYAYLRALTGQGVHTPAAIALDEAGAITGAPAIILERAEGKASAVDFLDARNAESSRQLSEQLAVITADIHRLDCGALASKSVHDSVLEVIDEWERKFIAHRLEPLPSLTYLFRWLKSNLPEPNRLSIIHGDLRPGNFLYQGSQLTAILDWEMAHVGDPAEDIAWIYRELWSPQKFLPLSEFIRIYQSRADTKINAFNLLYYRVFSEVKFATISLTAAHAFDSGQTDNLRHIDRAAKIPSCVLKCLQLIAESKGDDLYAVA